MESFEASYQNPGENITSTLPSEWFLTAQAASQIISGSNKKSTMLILLADQQCRPTRDVGHHFTVQNMATCLQHT